MREWELMVPGERVLLGVLAGRGATSERRHRRSEGVIHAWTEQTGRTFEEGYRVLCDLVRPWTLRLPLVEGVGNFGSPWGDDAAVASATACRLSPAGEQVVASRTGDVSPPPVSIVNGTLYRGGTAPAFDPKRIATALLLLQKQAVRDEQLIELVGAPVSPTGSMISGDVTGLLLGRRARLRFAPAVATDLLDDAAILRITNFAPPATATAAWEALARQRPDGSLRRIAARVEVSQDGDEVSCVIAPSSAVDAVIAHLLTDPTFSIHVDARLPASMPELLRAWTHFHGGADARPTLTRMIASVGGA